MAYDDSPYRRRSTDTPEPAGHSRTDDNRYGGPAYNPDAGYRSTTGYSASAFTTTDQFSSEDVTDAAERGGGRTGHAAGRRAGRSRRRGRSHGLDDVFDDPRHGERGRDRLGVHVTWEVILAAVVAGLGYLVYQEDPGVIGAGTLDRLLAYATGLGLLVLAAGVTLRAGAPNLAIGPVAVAAALHFAENGDNGVVPVLVTAMIWAVVLGLGTGVLVTGLQVPGWAASLIAAAVAIVFIQQRPGPVDLQGEYDPAGHALYLFGGFAALAVLGGAFGTIKTIRRTVGRFRPVADPAERRGALAALLTTGATVVSMVFAAVGGVLLAAVGSGPVNPTTGLEWSILAIGAALLGGTSVFGRRGGVFGGLLAVVSVTIFIHYAELRDLDIALYATGAVTMAVGLAVTRLIEAYGRPRPADHDEVDDDPDDGTDDDRGDADEDWSSAQQPAGENWPQSGHTAQESWSSTLPAQPTGTRDSWNAGERWDGGERWDMSGR
ncbi:ABC transporter permease [Solwaraspora sp. WMMB335]|uniref:ABC transporter permease n=1 Tax=Solwaraspora sp. WMMB335 TaxID=3404118 RepID=UPI003B95F660